MSGLLAKLKLALAHLIVCVAGCLFICGVGAALLAAIAFALASPLFTALVGVCTAAVYSFVWLFRWAVKELKLP